MARKYLIASAIAAVAVVVLLYAQNGTTGTLITPKEAQALMHTDTTAVVLDVRTAEEYYSDTGHLPRAILIPVQALEERIAALDQFKNRTIIVYCRTGHRSANAASILQKHGFKVFDIAGGITHWNAEELPVVKDVK